MCNEYREIRNKKIKKNYDILNEYVNRIDN